MRIFKNGHFFEIFECLSFNFYKCWIAFCFNPITHFLTNGVIFFVFYFFFIAIELMAFALRFWMQYWTKADYGAWIYNYFFYTKDLIALDFKFLTKTNMNFDLSIILLNLILFYCNDYYALDFNKLMHIITNADLILFLSYFCFKDLIALNLSLSTTEIKNGSLFASLIYFFYFSYKEMYALFLRFFTILIKNG